jgi:hypothetical protein
MQLLVFVPKPDGLFPDPGNAALRDGRPPYVPAGIALVFVMQSYFELQPTTDLDHVSTNFTVDASGPSIRQWEYPNALLSRMGVEINASNWLKEHNPESFDAESRQGIF